MEKNPILKVASIILLLLVVAGIMPIMSEAANDKISTDVRHRMLESEKVHIIIILKNQTSFVDISKRNIFPLKKYASDSQQSLESLLEEEKINGKADKIKQFWVVNAIALNSSPELIEKLAGRDDVAVIEIDHEFRTREDYHVQLLPGQITNATSELKHINATKAWELGIEGSGINVSVIDTGINTSHPDIAGRVIKWVDYVKNKASPYDDDGHGTHVAGTVGGNGSGGITTGVAPNVNLFGVKALNGMGSGLESDIITGIQWSIDNKADIISMSLGTDQTWTTPFCDSDDPAMAMAINNAVSSGVFVVAAAGNNAAGVSSPGCIRNATAAGAVDINDNIAYFSGRGPAMADHGFVAPGVDITSLNYLTNGYIEYSGTSMATPHIAGTVALLLNAAQKKGTDLSPAQVKNILGNTSIDLGTAGKDNNYGSGRIDAFEAVKGFLPGRGYVNGTVLDNDTKEGIAGAIVTTNTSVTATTNGTGFYSLDLTEGSYTLTVTRNPEYYQNSSVVVSVSKDTTAALDVKLARKPTGTITGSVTNVY